METKMVKFEVEDEVLGGILVNGEYIICGCCGSVFEVDEVTILKELSWINISEDILGDD